MPRPRRGRQVWKRRRQGQSGQHRAGRRHQEVQALKPAFWPGACRGPLVGCAAPAVFAAAGPKWRASAAQRFGRRAAAGARRRAQRGGRVRLAARPGAGRMAVHRPAGAGPGAHRIRRRRRPHDALRRAPLRGCLPPPSCRGPAGREAPFEALPRWVTARPAPTAQVRSLDAQGPAQLVDQGWTIEYTEYAGEAPTPCRARSTSSAATPACA